MKMFMSVKFLVFFSVIFSVGLFSASAGAKIKNPSELPATVPEVAKDGWEVISETDEDTWYVDKRTMSHPSKDIVKVWSKRVPAKESNSLSAIKEILMKRGKAFATYEYTKALFEVDCSKDMYRILSISHFDAKGKEIDSFKYPNAEWKSIDADSVNDALKMEVCEKK